MRISQHHSKYTDLRFSQETPVDWVHTLSGTLLAIRTVIWTPEHEARKIHPKVANELMRENQETAQSLDKTLAEIREIKLEKAAKNWPKISAKERMGMFAVLMQFTMYIPKIKAYFRTDCHDFEQLFNLITEHGKDKPLDFAEQLETALEIKPNLFEATWLLMVVSRQCARWYDGEAISGMPIFSKSEARAKMLKWSRSVVALKSWLPNEPQDSAGDCYYVWTHAMAKLLYGRMSPHWAPATFFYRSALHFGTWLNHNVAHKVSPQSIKSDHTMAARYGNAIGNVLSKV